MGKLTVNSPIMCLIELDRPGIRLDYPKAKCPISAASYFMFGMCQQLPTDTGLAMIAAHPEVADPIISGHGHAYDLFS